MPTIFQSCVLSLDGVLHEAAHDDQDCITYRIVVDGEGIIHTLRIDQDGIAHVNEDLMVRTTGAFSAALLPVEVGCLAYAQEDDQHGIAVYDEVGMFVRGYPEPYVAQAPLLRVNPDGTPLMNTNERNGRDVGGAKLYGWLEERGYICGFADNGLPGGCVFLQKPDGSCWMWSAGSDIQRPLEMAISADGLTCWIAVSHVDPPKPSELVGLMVPFAVVVRPVPVPTIITDVPFAPVPSALPPAYFGFWFDWKGRGGVAPGNTVCSDSPDDPRPFIGQIGRWPEPATRRVVGGYLGSEYISEGTYPHWLDREIAACKALNVPLHLFCDNPNHTATVVDAAAQCRVAGVTPKPLTHLRWHKTPGQTFLDAMRAWSVALGATGCLFAYHFQWSGREYALSPAQMAEQDAVTLALWQEFHWSAVLGFSWDRVGGVAHCPELIDHANEIAAATSLPVRRPVPPVVVKPPQPPPKPGKPPKPPKPQPEKPSFFSGKQ